MLPSSSTPREAWRQWHKATDQWIQRYEQFLASDSPLPPGVCSSRRRLMAFWQAREAAEQALLAECPAFPEVCRDLRCGARTRKGTPCKRRDLYASGRCRLHGGLSTGPTTAAGKRRAALNGRRPKRKRTP